MQHITKPLLTSDKANDRKLVALSSISSNIMFFCVKTLHKNNKPSLQFQIINNLWHEMNKEWTSW